MAKTDRKLDPDVIARTASVFATKARLLDHAALEMLAGDVLHHVAVRAQSQRQAEAGGVSQTQLSLFCDCLMGPDPARAMRFLEERQAEGTSHDTLCLEYLGAAAIWLGRQWDDSRLSFLDVTVAVGHLYALTRALRVPMAEAGQGGDRRRRALFATVPGEAHGLGITLAADMFRSAGWEIELRTGTDHDALVDDALRLQPPVIGLSLSAQNPLAALARLVVAQRLVAPAAIIAVAPPAGMEAEALATVVDVDLVIRDAVQARADLERIVTARAA
ncbi:MAG: cobalamin-dependent protein [Rhodobacteraceae bacterium]|nr:cobalamin-dependent protein [Paracoccaceae bacterium]